jgi:hypothetical protein
MTQHNGHFLHIVSQEMIPHLYMFGSGMKYWVFRYAYGTGAITKKWDLGALLTKVSQVYEIHNSWEQQLAAATYSASVVG